MNKLRIRRIPILEMSLFPPIVVTVLLPNYGEGIFSSLYLIGVAMVTILLYNSVVSHYGTQARSQETSYSADNHWLIRLGLILLVCGVGSALLILSLYFLGEYLEGVRTNAF